jgi:hypothetical protein
MLKKKLYLIVFLSTVMAGYIMGWAYTRYDIYQQTGKFTWWGYTVSFSTNYIPIKEYQKAIIERNDAEAYTRLSYMPYHLSDWGDFFIYSLLLANKYNNPKGNLGVYDCLTRYSDDINQKIGFSSICLGRNYLRRIEHTDDKSLKKEVSNRMDSVDYYVMCLWQ